MPGPVGKRSDQKHGHRTKEELAVDTAPSGGEVLWLEPDSDWHPIALNWYVQLADSGQSIYYQNSDVATAYYVAEAMSRSLKSGRFSGQLFAAIMSSMGDLLVTEGSRRRAKLELQPFVDAGDSGPSEVDLAIQQLSEQHAKSSD